MTTLFLVRHGHTDSLGKSLAGHTPGVGLNMDGIREAERLVMRLQQYPVRAIYSSPLQRALETAEPLSRALDLETQPRLRLIEVDFGDWTGRKFDDLANDPQWRRYNSLRSVTRAPNGDLMLDVQARIVDELEDLRTAHPNDTVVVVSHQDVIKAAIAHYVGMPLDLFQRFEIHPASVSVLHLADWGARLATLNNTGEF